MTWLAYTLIAVGGVFSLFNWASIFVSTQSRFVSPALFAGTAPLLIGLLLLPETRSLWWIAVLADYGTLSLLLAIPWLVREGWSTSSFRLAEELFHQSQGLQVTIRLYRSSVALLEISQPMRDLQDPEPHLVLNRLRGQWESEKNEVRISQYQGDRLLILRPTREQSLLTQELNAAGEETKDILYGLVVLNSKAP